MKRISIIISLFFVIKIFSLTRMMDIFFKEERIGYYTQKKTLQDSFFKVEEESKIKFRVYDNDIEIVTNSTSFYDKEWKIKKFFIMVKNENLNIYLNGFTQNGNLKIKTNMTGLEKIYNLEAKNKRILFNIESIDKNFLNEKFYILNPLTIELEPFDIKFLRKDTVKIKNKTIEVFEYSFKSKNSEFRVWFDRDNNVVKSISKEGIEMMLTDSVKEVKTHFNILNYFKIKAEGNFRNIRKENYAKYIIYGIDKKNLSNQRQEHKNDTLEVFRNSFRKWVFEGIRDTLFVLPDSQIILNAEKIFQESKGDTLKYIKNVLKFVNKKLKKTIFSGLISPGEIFKRSYGDCTEHAQLFASFMIAKGIKVNIVSGIVFSEGEFYYHAWNNLYYKGKIYSIDAVFNQFEVDPSHIEISSGFPPQEVLLENISGKIVIRRIK